MASDTHATTFVQADPSNFRAVVQRLTGATPQPQDPPSSHKHPPRAAAEVTPRFKLHERRQATGKLEITLNNGFRPFGIISPSARQRAEMMMTSPVSTLDFYGRGSPRTPVEKEEEEEARAIAEKGFYLHPSTPRGSEPELLPLFPLSSPKDDPSSTS